MGLIEWGITGQELLGKFLSDPESFWTRRLRGTGEKKGAFDDPRDKGKDKSRVSARGKNP